LAESRRHRRDGTRRARCRGAADARGEGLTFGASQPKTARGCGYVRRVRDIAATPNVSRRGVFGAGASMASFERSFPQYPEKLK
jgi:hypothetical protein